jgi:hypothetical protein
MRMLYDDQSLGRGGAGNGMRRRHTPGREVEGFGGPGMSQELVHYQAISSANRTFD